MLVLRDLGVTRSMSRSGNVRGNAAVENFFSSLKTGRTARRTFPSRPVAGVEVSDHIERFLPSDASALDARLQ